MLLYIVYLCSDFYCFLFVGIRSSDVLLYMYIETFYHDSHYYVNIFLFTNRQIVY